MKFNWGHGVTIFILSFMAFIVTLVVMTFNKNADLVQDDYYEQEVLFEDKQQSIANYAQADYKIEIKHQEEGFTIIFPVDFEQNTKGNIRFYRFNNKNLDKSYNIEVNDSNQQVFAYSEFREGAYELSINWKQQNQDYLYQTKVIF
jgi:hypothetical protein